MLFNNSAGDAVDNMLMKITGNRWLKKTVEKKLNSHGVVMGMHTGKHFAKPDPVNFQSKLLLRHENRVSRVLQEYEQSLAQ